MQLDLSVNSVLTSTFCGGACPPSFKSAASAYIETDSSFTLNGVAGLQDDETPLPNGLSDIVVPESIGPNGLVDFEVQIDAVSFCEGTASCTSNADLLDPLKITGATIFDSNGNIVPDATIVSQSGFNPNAVTAPEPSSLLLTGMGLFALIGMNTKRTA